MSEENRHEAEEVRELLDVVADRIPALLKGLRDVLYAKDAAENMADAVATFYKKLVEAGIPKEEALDMARGYMINLRDVLSSKGLGNIELDKRREEKEED
ncbi:hypothetical protein LR090_05765 [Candidatus Bipolaricaulota bacterium]|nr:hypothetical protein [Candidatus Bipolaricaulota bacterium]